MIRDPGPYQNIGFGVPPLQVGEERGTGGEGAIAQFFGKHPIAKFLGTAAASLVSMSAAGAVVRRGGMEAAMRLQKHALKPENMAGQVAGGIRTFRRIEAYMDELQGVTRVVDDPLNLVTREGRRLRRTDKANITDGWHERTLNPNPDLPDWALKDEIQQRIVRQARRLPYELPGFYVAQKAILDPMLGNDDRPVNWANPVDVIGDFASESLKNIALNVIPFDVGMGAGVSKYRQLANKIRVNPTGSQNMANTSFLLEQVGASATDILNRTLRFSNQSIGAFSQMVDDSMREGKSFTQTVRSLGTGSIFTGKPTGNAWSARRTFENAKIAMKDGDLRRQVLDTLPGPFKGLGTGVGNMRKNFNEIGETYDDWQDVISGRTTFDRLRRTASDRSTGVQRADRLTAFMEKGGGTYLERFAKDASTLNRWDVFDDKGRLTPGFRGSNFYRDRSQQEFQTIFADTLSAKTGLTPEHAEQFARLTQRLDIADKSRHVNAGYNIAQRIQFGQETFQGTRGEWWDDVVRRANAHDIPLGRPAKNAVHTQEAFEAAVRIADSKFTMPLFRRNMDKTIGNQWLHVRDEMIPRQAAKSISWIKRPFEEFAGGNLQNERDYLIRQTAQRLGVNVATNAGQPIPIGQLEKSLRDNALEPTNLEGLRGFLMRKGDIGMPWQIGGRNLFGFKPLAVQQAMDNGFFGARDKSEQEMIKRFVEHKSTDAVAQQTGLTGSQAWRMRTGGAYTDAAGNVIDLGRVRRGFSNFVDTLTNEVQVPILHFNPLQIFGRKSFTAQRNAPTISMFDPMSNQPFLRKTAQGPRSRDDFMLWIKDNANRASGRVFGVSGGGATGVTENAYAGLYRQWLTNDKTMIGNISRVTAGNMGVPSSSAALETLENRIDPTKPVSRRAAFKARMRNLYDVAYDQENSVFVGQQSLIRRLRAGRKKGGAAQYSNPNVLARRLGQRGMRPDEMTSEMSEGMDSLMNLLSNYGFSPRALRQIANDPEFRDVFGPVGNIFDIEDAALPRIAKKLLDEDRIDIANIPNRQTRMAMSRAGNNLRSLLRQGEKQDRFWDLPVSETKQATTGVNRRIDQLRNRVTGYLFATKDLRAKLELDADGQLMDLDSDVIGSLFAKIDTMKVNGQITAREATEARAATLGLQVQILGNRAYAEVATEGTERGVGFVNREVNQRLIGLIDEEAIPGGTLETLTDVGNMRVGNYGPVGFIKSLSRRNLPASSYTKPYEVNPFGSDYLLMPTAGTVAEQSGLLKAAKGATLSWSDPEAVSGITAISTHMATRLNRYFETFGLGLDPSRYQGPADFYARGIMGRRVLPAVAAGSTIMAADRTLGGMVNQDQFGNPIYAPLILGGAADVVATGQTMAAGIVPGGQTAEEKREELESGEVPIRQGRYWFLSNQPWKGGRIQYFRPSWYQRFKAGGSYTPEMNETPLERLAYGYDFSPLRPLDPYRREREDRLSRPYPVSGDYFTGPWGALNPVLNATIGNVLKPQRELFPQETQPMLAQYSAVGRGGAFFGNAQNTTQFTAAASLSQINQGYMGSQPGTGSSQPFYGGMGYASPRGTASDIVRSQATQMASAYSAQAQAPGGYIPLNQNLAPYGVPVAAGFMGPRVIPTGEPYQSGAIGVRAGDLGFRVQETMGIYGFAAANVRSSLGFGSQDFTPNRAVLEPASRGYSASRAFWNLNLGGLGDMPIAGESKYSNFEVSEIVRRFVPKDPQGITYVNDLPNLMGQQYPWLPGNEYPLNSIATGDPYSFPDAEIRLPGTGYARTHQLFPDEYGQLGLANIHDILADTAPWSQQFRQIDSMANGADLSPLARAKINQTRAQVDAMRIKKEFTPYTRQNESWMDTIRDPAETLGKRIWEQAAHRDTFLNQKFLPVHTAVEDWERENVYGATFPSWTSPYESYIQSFLNKSTQRGPVGATLVGAGLGAMFGASPRARALGTIVGGGAGAIASMFGKGYEAITGDRYIPEERRKQIALENYMDILKYTRASINAARASAAGRPDIAEQFVEESQQTMYGADLNSTPERLAMAMPERKREHFRAMLYAPENERERILSTAGRLERRLFQAAWGMDVEARPDLPEYFEERELPGPDSEFWNPSTDIETVKIKVGQSIGLDMAQMGYYPQQIQEANLVNPSYPQMFANNSRRSIAMQIRQLLRAQGANGDVVAIPNVFGEDRVQLTAGVYN